MRPLELKFTGLRSYYQTQHIDLRGHTLVGITGNTGAGKSTIFEGIFFALYGTCTFDATNPRALIADGGTGTLSAELTFQARGKTWKVTRSLSRGSNPSVHRLEEIDGTVKVSGKRDVNRRIEELVGLDAKTFIKSVILPQGKFERLLHTAPGERASILKSLLGLDLLDTIQVQVRERRDALTPLLHQLKEQRAALLPNPRQTAEAAEITYGAEQRRLAQLNEAADTIEKIRNERDKQKKEAQDSRAIAEQLTYEIDTSSVVRLRELADNDAAISAELELLAGETEAVKQAQLAVEEALGEYRPGGRLAGITALAMSNLPALRANCELTTQLEEHLTAEAAAISALTNEADQLDKQAKTDRQAAEQAAATFVALQQAARDAQQELQHAQDLLRDYRQLVHEVSELGAQAVARQHDMDQTAEQLKLAENEASRSEAELNAAITEHEAQKRTHSAAHAASGLSAGDACPICTHELPQGFTPPETPSLKEAERKEKAAKKKVEAAGSKVTEAIASKASADGHLRQTHAHLESRHRVLAESASNLIVLIGRFDDQADDGMVLANALARTQKAFNEAEAADETRKAFQDRATKTDTLSQARRGELNRRTAQHNLERANLTKLQATAAQLLSDIPEQYRPSDTSQGALERAEGLAASDDRRISAQHQHLSTLNQQLTINAERRTELGERRTRDVIKPAAQHHQAVTALLAKHNLLAARIGHTAAPVGNPGAEIKDQASWAEQVIRQTAPLLEAVRAHLDEVDSRLTGLDKQINEIAVEAPTRGLDLQQAITAAIGAVAVAKEQRDNAQTQIEQADDLDRRITASTPHINALNDLVALLKDGKFIAAVVHERQQSLLGTATGLLREMTLGQFAFGPDFEVFDSHTGMLRDVKTLSGGESFQASLALALAVVEQANSAGGRAEALFLDEGFGTLDETALGYALDALNSQVDAGRLVVVISHMKAVAQHVPALLKVEKASGGSTARWLNEAERADLADDDLLSGLSQ